MLVRKFSTFSLTSLIAAASLLLGCTREMKKEVSKISLQIPRSVEVASKGMQAQSVNLAQTCFAVHVTGDGIDKATNSCNMDVGLVSGMVKGGGVIELEVPKGDNRKIEIARYELASAADACPQFNPLDCNSSIVCEVYPSGKVEGVSTNTDVVEVNITLDTSAVFPIQTSGACSGKVIAGLTEAGGIVNGSGESVASGSLDDASYDSISRSGDGVDGWDNSGNSSSGDSAPPFVRSLTKKPDSGELLGLIGENELVRVSGGIAQVVSMSSYYAASCSIPAWAQSISAGYNNIFIVDHGGGVHRIENDCSTTLITSVSQRIKQVIVH